MTILRQAGRFVLPSHTIELRSADSATALCGRVRQLVGEIVECPVRLRLVGSVSDSAFSLFSQPVRMRTPYMPLVEGRCFDRNGDVTVRIRFRARLQEIIGPAATGLFVWIVECFRGRVVAIGPIAAIFLTYHVLSCLLCFAPAAEGLERLFRGVLSGPADAARNLVR
jgi:hypothetical protein